MYNIFGFSYGFSVHLPPNRHRIPANKLFIRKIILCQYSKETEIGGGWSSSSPKLSSERFYWIKFSNPRNALFIVWSLINKLSWLKCSWRMWLFSIIRLRFWTRFNSKSPSNASRNSKKVNQDYKKTRLLKFFDAAYFTSFDSELGFLWWRGYCCTCCRFKWLSANAIRFLHVIFRSRVEDDLCWECRIRGIRPSLGHHLRRSYSWRKAYVCVSSKNFKYFKCSRFYYFFLYKAVD